MMKKAHGFTIVELLIVIVVIAILAALSYVGYTSMSNRALDSRTADGAAQFAKAISLWSVDRGSSLQGNSGSSAAMTNGVCSEGAGEGFVASRTYTCTTEDTLIAANLLPAGFVQSLPPNPYHNTSVQDGRYSLMLYRCSSRPGAYILFWTLRQPPSGWEAEVNKIQADCGRAAPSTITTTWGMRAARLIEL